MSAATTTKQRNTTKTIRIKRAKKGSENPYFDAARATAQDRNISFEARGMLFYLLSKPDDWEAQPKDLEQQCGENRVYRILKELRFAKYIVYVVDRDKRGKITGHYYDVYECPVDDLPRLDNPRVENPRVENHHTYIIENIENPESVQSTEGTEKEPPTPAVETTDPEREGTDAQVVGSGEPTAGESDKSHSGESSETPSRREKRKEKRASKRQFTKVENDRRGDLAIAHCKYLGVEVDVAFWRATINALADQFPDLTGEQYAAFLTWHDMTYPDRQKLQQAESITRNYRIYRGRNVSIAPSFWTEENHPDPEALKSHPHKTMAITAYIRLFEVPQDKWWTVFKCSESELWASIRRSWDTYPGTRNRLKDLAPVVEQKLKGA